MGVNEFCEFRDWIFAEIRKTAPMPTSDTDSAIREWLENAFKQTGRKKIDLAKHLAVAPSAITRIMNGERKISTAELFQAGDFFGDVPSIISALINDRGAKDVLYGPSAVLGLFDYSLSNGQKGNDRPIPPVYMNEFQVAEIDLDAKVSTDTTLGAEAFFGKIYEPHFIKSIWQIPPDTISGYGSKLSTTLRCFKQFGDAMSPTINANDVVFVDINYKHICDAGLYAIEDVSGRIVVRRCEVLNTASSSGHQVRISCDNERYVERLEPSELVRVAGRVTSLMKQL